MTEALAHSSSQGTGDTLSRMGRVPCSSRSAEWIPYVCRRGECGVGCPVVIRLLDVFWCQVLRKGLLWGVGWGVEKRGKKGCCLGLSAVGHFVGTSV